MTTRAQTETYQDSPCKRGHSGIRYRKGGACVECVKISDAAKRARKVAAEKPT